MTDGQPMAWRDAREAAYLAGRAATLPAVELPLAGADGLTLATPLTTLTALPAFPTASVDGYAVRGPAPWRVTGQVLAGAVPAPLPQDGLAAEIATGAMVPGGAEAILRVEEATIGDDGMVSGTPRPTPEWREPGEEAAKGEELLPSGTPITPGVLGLAASCGYDSLLVHPAPRVTMRIFGDELLTSGPPGDGRVRDSLGPQVPGWLRRLGAVTIDDVDSYGPIEDTLDAHIEAVRTALDRADVVCTTGGTMHGPVDHLHPALAALGARYVVNTVAVRPGYPMLLAEVPSPGDGRPRFVAGLPGNPQSAIIALMSLVEPLLRGMARRSGAVTRRVTLGGPVPGRGNFTHLALARIEEDGMAYPLGHAGSAMLRGLAGADGFAVIQPGTSGQRGDTVPLVPMPTVFGGRP